MINPVGYFKLWRELFTKPIWLNSTPEQCKILITLLAMANYKPKQWEWQGSKFEVKEGQFITSLDSIKEKCGDGITIQNVRTALKRFEKLQFLTNESTKTGRLITIVNWELYQANEEEPNNDANKELTKSQQRANKELTPREERKKDKKEKNIYSEFVSMTEDEHQKLIDKYGELNTKKMIEVLNNYKGSNGKKYNSDYLAILNWVVEKVVKTEQKPEFKRPDSNVVVAPREFYIANK